MPRNTKFASLTVFKESTGLEMEDGIGKTFWLLHKLQKHIDCYKISKKYILQYHAWIKRFIFTTFALISGGQLL